MDTPRLYAYLPPRAEKPAPAIIVCPGGGYAGLAHIHEGINIAEWFLACGVAAFVFHYRLPADGYPHPTPLQDVQRAVRVVRARAAEFNVDPARLAIIGFSAGGHLVSTLDTHFDAGDPHAADPVDRERCRPDFTVLVYRSSRSRPPASRTKAARPTCSAPTPIPPWWKISPAKRRSRRRRRPPCSSTPRTTTPCRSRTAASCSPRCRRAGVPAALHIYPAAATLRPRCQGLLRAARLAGSRARVARRARLRRRTGPPGAPVMRRRRDCPFAAAGA
ncbi:MAG: alpha/beta hydrolase [Verrucomicrobiota bacterium]